MAASLLTPNALRCSTLSTAGGKEGWEDFIAMRFVALLKLFWKLYFSQIFFRGILVYSLQPLQHHGLHFSPDQLNRMQKLFGQNPAFGKFFKKVLLNARIRECTI